MTESGRDVLDGEARLHRALTEGVVDPDALIAAVAGPNLVGNVVRHAAGPIEIELQWSEIPSIVVRDRGPGFTLRAFDPDLFAEGGRLVHRAATRSSPVLRRLQGSLHVRREPVLVEAFRS